MKTFVCAYTHEHCYSFILSFILAFYFHGTLEAVTAHWFLNNSLNDNIHQNLIICIHLYSSRLFLKINVLMLGFFMSLPEFCLGWDMRQDWQWSIWGIKLLLACLNKQRSRRVAAGLVFSVTHSVYTMGVFVWQHNEFPNGVCVAAGNS